jgi:ATP-dependent Clp protease ATP-binding subunit ClpC
MTQNEEDFIENLPRNESYNDDSGQDDSLKVVLTIQQINQ